MVGNTSVTVLRKLSVILKTILNLSEHYLEKANMDTLQRGRGHWILVLLMMSRIARPWCDPNLHFGTARYQRFPCSSDTSGRRVVAAL